MPVKKKDKNNPKPRNWLAVHAHGRTGAGSHASKKKYSRKDNKKQLRKAKEEI